MTTMDGYPMAMKGKAEQALKTGIVSSLFGGLFSAAILFFFAPTLADFAIKFSYVEKFLIIFLALTIIASLSKNLLTGLFSGALGIWLSLIGAYDINKGGNGEIRLMFDWMEDSLSDGFSLLPVLIGLFGMTVILEEAGKGVPAEAVTRFNLKDTQPFSLSVFKGQIGNLIRSSTIGTFIGLLPGIGGSAASVLAYTQQKNLSRHPEKMGTGVPEGVIASESSNNGLTGGALIPLVSLGIPGDATTAVMIGAFTLQGVQVGPLFIGENPQTWDLMVVSLFLADFVMFFVMFYAIRYIVKIIQVPKYLLYPLIVVMCAVGSYTANGGIMVDVWTFLLFGVAGFFGQKMGLEVTPLIIGFILGKDAEIYFVKSIEAYGSFSIFFTKSPIAVFLWVLIAVSLVYSFWNLHRAHRREREGVSS